MNEEKYIKLVQELLDGVDRGEFVDIAKTPAYTYGHLTALFYLAGQLDGGRELYEKMYDRFIEYGKENVRRKIKCGQKVRVAFLAISAAEWPVENIYRMLSKDERLECFVVLCPLVDRDREARRKTEEQSYNFFASHGYDVRRVYYSKDDGYVQWSQIGGVPDIVVHLTSCYEALPKPFRIEEFPLSTLSFYIPYGMYVANSADGNYVKQAVYNKQFANLMCRIYTDSEINLAGYEKYGLLHGKNVLYSGYAKMDHFQEKREYAQKEIRDIWGMSGDADVKGRKRLIIAPHHSIETSAGVEFSTFTRNAYFWLYLAKKYQDKITFIFKPHPNLRLKTVWAHFFKTFADYDAYLEEWDRLPNARVSEEESYLDIFATSDGMIMDSGSFLGEYMYVNKPLLFLTREEQAFNSLGEKCVSAYYKAKGEDFLAIEQFVEDVILRGEDTMKENRTRVFEENLNYKGRNGCTASEFIYKDMLKVLE